MASRGADVKGLVLVIQGCRRRTWVLQEQRLLLGCLALLCVLGSTCLLWQLLSVYGGPSTDPLPASAHVHVHQL
jgi:hypothetical protein